MRADPPDVAVLELRMPPTFADEGLATATAVRAPAPDVGLLLRSQHVEVNALRLMTDFDGGVGYREHRRVLAVLTFLRA